MSKSITEEGKRSTSDNFRSSSQANYRCAIYHEGSQRVQSHDRRCMRDEFYELTVQIRISSNELKREPLNSNANKSLKRTSQTRVIDCHQMLSIELMLLEIRQTTLRIIAMGEITRNRAVSTSGLLTV